MGNQISISRVINISVAAAQTALGQYNTSNIVIFSPEAYDAGTFGDDGYKIYLSPDEVGTDWGTDSDTYKMALKIFSQQPNILAGGGYLVIIPLVTEVQQLAFSAAPGSGTYVVNFDGEASAAVNWNDTAAQIQTKLREITGLEKCVVTGTAATTVVISMKGYYGNAPLITITSNTLNGSITVTPSATTTGETLAAAITRTKSLVEYFGILTAALVNETDMLAAAAVVQNLIKLAFFVSNEEADVDTDGMLDLLTQQGYTQSRGLYYGGTLEEALQMMAAYASRGLSVNFGGSNTTITMHLKQLIGVSVDPTMTETILQKCIDAGVDTYVSIQGVAAVFCSGANDFFDDQYNLRWLVGALQVAGFNFLAQASTKVPQTESGMTALKGAYRQVCEQGVINQFLAPGEWTSPVTFGNQVNFLLNIQQRGFYIYSAPVSQQSPATRVTREAPLCQIAIKYAGAIHKSSVIVNVNP